MENNIFRNIKLINKSGEIVSSQALHGKEVAIYFAGSWCPTCREFNPHLNDFYKSTSRNVQLIFASSDFDAASATNHFESQGNWLSFIYGDPIIDELKQKYLVWSGRESSKFGIFILFF